MAFDRNYFICTSWFVIIRIYPIKKKIEYI